MNSIQLIYFGQSSIRIKYKNITIYIDPYFTNSVEKTEGAHLKRLISIPFAPETVNDADIVLISHIHQDHCDLDTLIPIYKNSIDSKFIGPRVVCEYLINNGFNQERVFVLTRNEFENNDVKIYYTLASHPVIELDSDNHPKYIGFIIDINGYKIYHSGDTSLCDEVVNSVLKYKPIKISCLPINEDNYKRRKAGIIGNMGVRDAIYFSEILEVEKMVPLHWDMFECNYVLQDEFNIIYSNTIKQFEVIFNPNLIIN